MSYNGYQFSKYCSPEIIHIILCQRYPLEILLYGPGYILLKHDKSIMEKINSFRLICNEIRHIYFIHIFTYFDINTYLYTICKIPVFFLHIS